MMLPVGYYEDFVAAENAPDSEKWYLRPHHVETLTEHPLSKKDNVIHTHYKSKLDHLPPSKLQDEHLIEENINRKSELIDSLEDRLASLRRDLSSASRAPQLHGTSVSPAIVDNYLTKLTEDKQDKELELATYEGVLYDLRCKEKGLLNNFRAKESAIEGEPGTEWWARKDKGFNVELRKERLLGEGEAKGLHR